MEENKKTHSKEYNMLDDYSHLTGWKRNPYAERLQRAEKLYHGETVVIDSEVIKFFKELSKTKGVHYSTLMSETLKDYIINVQLDN